MRVLESPDTDENESLIHLFIFCQSVALVFTQSSSHYINNTGLTKLVSVFCKMCEQTGTPGV